MGDRLSCASSDGAERVWVRRVHGGAVEPRGGLGSRAMCSTVPPGSLPAASSSTGIHPQQAGGHGRMRHHHGHKWRGAGMLDRTPAPAVQLPVAHLPDP